MKNIFVNMCLKNLGFFILYFSRNFFKIVMIWYREVFFNLEVNDNMLKKKI